MEDERREEDEPRREPRKEDALAVGSNPPGTAEMEGQVKKYFFFLISNFYV